MKHTIKVRTDHSCEMAEVLLDDELVMMGNFWDFHPGCCDVTEYGNFSSYATLSTAIYQHLVKSGVPYNEIETITEQYEYE